MTFEQAFLKVKEKFENADASKTPDFAIQVTFTDEDCGGTFYAEVKEGKLAVEPYNYYDNNAVLNISKSSLLALIAGRISLDKAIANGATVQGDASKIADWKNTIKKAPAAKTGAKKATAKKTTKAAKTTTTKKTETKTTATKTTTAAKTTTAKKAEPTATAVKTADVKKAEPKVSAKKTAVKETKTSTKTTK